MTGITLQSSKVQTYLTGKLTTHLSGQLRANVSVGRVDIAFFNKMTLEHVLIQDRQDDTLVYVPSLSTRVDKLHLRQKKLILKEITLDNSFIRISRDSAGSYNFHFLIEAFEDTDRSNNNWQYICNTFNFNQAEAVLHDLRAQTADDIKIHNLNTRVTGFSYAGDSIHFQIDNLTFNDEKGLKIKTLNAGIQFKKNNLEVAGLHLETDHSRIQNSRLQVELPADSGSVVESAQFELQLRPSQISFSDVAHLVPGLQGMNQVMQCSGTIQGNRNNLRGKDLALQTGTQTYAFLDFYANDMSDKETMYLFVDLKESQTTLAELSRIRLPGKGSPRFLEFPDVFYESGRLTYQGIFTGFLTDFVTYGTLHSDMGKISTDLAVVPDEKKNITYRGKIATEDFSLGELIKNKYAGDISFSGKVDGMYNFATHLLAGKFAGDISQVEINGYRYENIRLDGVLDNRMFDGLVAMNDPNLQFDFLGKVNFNPDIPVFDFRLDLKKALPENLNVDVIFPESELSFLMEANFSGNQIDNLGGSIHVEKGFYKNINDTLDLGGIELQSISGELNNYISLSSPYFDVEINGLYHFRDILSALGKSMSPYLPALGYEPEPEGELNKFGYQINGKNMDAVTAVFAPQMKIETPFLLYGQMDSEKSVFELKGSIPMIRTNNLMLQNIFIGNSPDDGLYQSQFRIGEILLKNGMHLNNLTIHSKIAKNTINNQISWGPDDTGDQSGTKNKYRGQLHSQAVFSPSAHTSFPHIDINGISSQIFLADSLWQIDPFRIAVDSSVISISDFLAYSSGQTIAINGEIAKNDSSLLTVSMEEINLAKLGDYLEKELPLEGTMNGSMQLKDFYGQRLLFSELEIDRFRFRNQEIGNVSVNNQWDKNHSGLNTEVKIATGQRQNLYANGFYIPETGELGYEAELDQLPLVILETVIRNNFSGFQGMGSGKVKIHGTPDKILLTGALEGKEAGLTIDYTRVGYQFTDSVYFRGDTILFDDIRIMDPAGNRGTFRGTIVHQNFQDMRYDLELFAPRITAIDTRANNNPQFYGQVMANGRLYITGRGKSVSLTGSGTTLPGTNVNISLEDQSVLERYDFIQFVSAENKDREEFLFPEKDNKNFNLDLTITATPDARAQLIYNSQIGDVIRARGEGILRFGMDNEGDMTLSGSYTVEQGDYLFTLQNVINKRFTIEQGGTIEWSGSPYNALIDINAVYKLKASLYDLLVNTYDNIYQSQRIPVECKIILSEELSNPTIDFAIDFPSVEDRLVEELKQFFNTSEEMNRQILSLVVLGKFYTPEYLRGTYEAQNPNLIGTTASELFSNQLSNWLSQISSNVDIGLNYRPGTQITDDEIELALSTQMFNDRVTINGNIGNNSNPNSANNSQLVGDFEVNVKLTPSGKIRFKAYNRSNNNLIYETAPYTQGVGFTFTENFNTFDDLLKKMQAIFIREEEE